MLPEAVRLVGVGRDGGRDACQPMFAHPHPVGVVAGRIVPDDQSKRPEPVEILGGLRMDNVTVGVRPLRKSDLRAGNVQETVRLAAYEPARLFRADDIIGGRDDCRGVLGFGSQRGEGSDEIRHLRMIKERTAAVNASGNKTLPDETRRRNSFTQSRISACGSLCSRARATMTRYAQRLSVAQWRSECQKR